MLNIMIFLITFLVDICLVPGRYTKWLLKLSLARVVGEAAKVEQHGNPLDDDCVVCLSQISHGEKLRVLPLCNHGFHVHCIDAWLKYHPSCPLCRRTINHFPHQQQHDCLLSYLLSLFGSFCRWMENPFHSNVTLAICENINYLS
jgi:hypothetical protein